jgi:hypothetical protein
MVPHVDDEVLSNRDGPPVTLLLIDDEHMNADRPEAEGYSFVLDD